MYASALNAGNTCCSSCKALAKQLYRYGCDCRYYLLFFYEALVRKQLCISSCVEAVVQKQSMLHDVTQCLVELVPAVFRNKVLTRKRVMHQCCDGRYYLLIQNKGNGDKAVHK